MSLSLILLPPDGYGTRGHAYSLPDGKTVKSLKELTHYLAGRSLQQASVRYEGDWFRCDFCKSEANVHLSWKINPFTHRPEGSPGVVHREEIEEYVRQDGRKAKRTISTPTGQLACSACMARGRKAEKANRLKALLARSFSQAPTSLKSRPLECESVAAQETVAGKWK